MSKGTLKRPVDRNHAYSEEDMDSIWKSIKSDKKIDRCECKGKCVKCGCARKVGDS